MQPVLWRWYEATGNQLLSWNIQSDNLKNASEGKRDKFQGFNERIAGMPAEQIKKIRNRIGIAGGVERVKAVKGAIAGGYINILITNNECAEKLL